MTCCDEVTLELYREGLLDPEQEQQVDQHLAECPACQERLLALTQEEGALAEALTLSPLETEALRIADLPARLSRQVKERRRTERLLGAGLVLFLLSAAFGLKTLVLPLLGRWPFSLLAPAQELLTTAGARLFHTMRQLTSAGTEQQALLLPLVLTGLVILLLNRRPPSRHAHY